MRSDVRFWFQGRLRSVSAVSPQKTVLRWLREDEGLLGTKEGCGEGDCGACTVVVGSLDPSAPQGVGLRSVNSCLLLVPALDGKALFTVEDLAGADLHPVQRALVDHHASQCGFCTPGFAMSLWADYQERSGAPERAETASVLAGNLCRCTGYRPLLDAARAAWDYPVVKLDKRPVADALAAVQDSEALEYSHDGQSWKVPHTLDELADEAQKHPRARLLGGATDVGLWVTKGLKDLGNLISVTAVAELREVRDQGGALSIGAAAPLADAFRALVARYPELAEWADRFASPPVRHAGTLGGNLANGSPIGDGAPVLLALGATVELRLGPRTRELPLEQFFIAYQKTALEPGEVLVRISVPAPAPGSVLRAWKVSKRRDQDISAVAGAFYLVHDGHGVVTQARLAYGGMAAVPARARRAEVALTGRRFDTEALAAARLALDSDFTPLTDGRASADYRRAVAANLLTRLQAEVSAQGAL
jgi:xanthine dehydrogenase small subunit